MLSGRWVRGRRKVMKKPVRAIDMRRTATVLDFAVRGISGLVARVVWKVLSYLSSPFCVIWIDDATPENGLDFSGCGRTDVRFGGVCGRVRFGMAVDIGSLVHLKQSIYNTHSSFSISIDLIMSSY
jgi:hypothetical protein